jgi:hypothetical protein
VQVDELEFLFYKERQKGNQFVRKQFVEKENKFSTIGHGGDKRETNKREEEEDIVRQHQKKNTAE